MTDRIERREFLNLSLSAMGGAAAAGWTAASSAQLKTVKLEELDLGKLEVDPTLPPPVGQLRTDKGIRFCPGSSLWVDLEQGAETFTGTLELEAGSGARSVVCRISTGAESRDEIVWARRWSPKMVTLPLAGRDTLFIETEAVESRNGITVVLTNASIGYSGAQPEAFTAAPIEWETPEWQVRIDGKTGAIVRLSHPEDRHAMSWIRPTGRWGNGLLRLGGASEAWLRPSRVRRRGPRAIELEYRTSVLGVRVKREIDAGFLRESYTFTNSTARRLDLEEGALGILAPLNDRYPGADVCLTRCCNAHVWPGGHGAWLSALRMGGVPPHLGLVVVDGAIPDYSIVNRAQTSNDRGSFLLHPEAMSLAPGASRTVSCVLFWHQGWDDFFARAASLPGFVRLEADQYTVETGQPLRIRASAARRLDGARMLANDSPVATRPEGIGVAAEFMPSQPGEQRITLELGGRRTLLRGLVILPPLDLIRRRMEFIVRHQQKRAAGEPLDGAYLIYDNETNQQVYSRLADHNAAQERLGMGVLGALYLPHCRDEAFRAELAESLARYQTFVERELQDDTGVVFEDVGRRPSQRLYNYPWVAHFNLAMFQATGRRDSLQRFASTCRTFYQRGGARFYPIGLPIRSGLTALETAGLTSERDTLLALFRGHADTLAATGTAYPTSEVNYEQSIVGPAVQILLEVYLVTKEPGYLEAARRQLGCLEAFNGRQPDYHLHEIAIRHWDDYWFGKRRVYGDTQPHYWSTITAVAFHLYAEATGDDTFAGRARGILLGNLAAFFADGRASCAYVNPRTVNGQPGRFFDPWANDQDWALVNWLVTQLPARP